MADNLQVELVAADREVWSGEARLVLTRTIEGELGIMAHHTPLLSVLDEGQVEVRTADDGHWVAAIDGGFISVAENRVSILCEHAELSHESNFDEAKRKLEASKEEDEAQAR